MRPTTLLAAVLSLAAGPALAQTVSTQAPHRTAHPPSSQRRGHAGGTPLDVGPFTPEASRAYQGGGVILQGAPGDPAPLPEATPPGQMPRSAVPPGQ